MMGLVSSSVGDCEYATVLQLALGTVSTLQERESEKRIEERIFERKRKDAENGKQNNIDRVILVCLLSLTMISCCQKANRERLFNKEGLFSEEDIFKIAAAYAAENHRPRTIVDKIRDNLLKTSVFITVISMIVKSEANIKRWF